MLDLEIRRIHVAVFIVGVIVLSMTAEKSRELLGESDSSKSGQFTFLNCFDMGSGTLACSVKEGVKLYVYSVRSAHVEKVRQRAIETALTEALTGGLAASDAAKQAQKAGTKAAKLASRQAKRILGPIISSGWDFFEAIYYGGTIMEGFLRGTGTLFGTYVGGFQGEQRLGKLGYLTGSHLGSWVGGRIGLMIYDVINGVNHLLQFVQLEESTRIASPSEDSDIVDSYAKEENMRYEAPSEDSEFADSYARRENTHYDASSEEKVYTEETVDESSEAPREDSEFADSYARRKNTHYDASSEEKVYIEETVDESSESWSSEANAYSEETIGESSESGWGLF